jgi:NADH:ubiquinone oxidoreductase subunit 5 (subunit L)/multisubunit Na+/H+ antiporter MnhA subunit
MVGLSSYLLIGFHHDAERDRGREEGVRDERDRRRDDGARALPADQQAHVAPVQRARGVTRSARREPRRARAARRRVAKSAQLPLQTWLPDAMEGPTPVSALIHAATMVTAGVYLIVRTHPIFEQAPTGRRPRRRLGAATLLVAGLIALVQVDIKRVIAYSTMSQIGYMFLGAGSAPTRTRCST